MMLLSGWCSASAARERARVDEFLHDGVIPGDLGELVALEPVHPAVADVEDREVRRAVLQHERGTGDRRAHPELGLAREFDDVVGCSIQCSFDALGRHERAAGHVGEVLDDRRAREVARAVSAHAVGDGEQR